MAGPVYSRGGWCAQCELATHEWSDALMDRLQSLPPQHGNAKWAVRTTADTNMAGLRSVCVELELYVPNPELLAASWNIINTLENEWSEFEVWGIRLTPLR